MNDLAEISKQLLALKALETFETEEEAWVWMKNRVDDPHMDSERMAYTSDEKAVEAYSKLLSEECCGFFDEAVIIGGRVCLMGAILGIRRRREAWASKVIQQRPDTSKLQQPRVS